jgi:hypothetical protein
VLINLEGTVLCRTKGEDLVERAGCLDTFETGSTVKNIYYFRPGYAQFIADVIGNKRARFAFYSSKERKNIEPIVQYIQEKTGLNGDMMHIFDQSHTTKMTDKAEFQFMVGANEWNRYRDLEKVWADPWCEGRFSARNTLLIESDETKVQMNLGNSLIPSEFTKEHVE